MPIYPDSSWLHPEQGMTQMDIEAAKRVAAARNEIIMFRNTGCWSRPYIALGHPTKPFHVKGKSSDWGPQAGLVPEDSEFSKAFKDDDIAKGIKLNKEAIAHNYARPVRLFITEQFLRDELLVPKSIDNRPAISRITTPRDDVMYFFCTKPNDKANLPGKNYVLLGKKGSGDLIEIFSFPLDAAGARENTLFLKESSAKPLMVMTVPGADKPITGDYDLFAICPSWADYGSKDRKMDPTLDDVRISKSNFKTLQKSGYYTPQRGEIFDRESSIASLAKLEAAKTPEDPHKGNITPRILEVIGALKGGMGGLYPRVHHNAESGRPFAPGAADGFPLTTIHPRRGIGGYNFLDATINDLGDLRDYFNRLYADGYYPPRNRAWQMPTLNPHHPR